LLRMIDGKEVQVQSKKYCAFRNLGGRGRAFKDVRALSASNAVVLVAVDAPIIQALSNRLAFLFLPFPPLSLQ
jgi:hypothetical protein